MSNVASPFQIEMFTQIDVAASEFTGTSPVVVSLLSDSSGKPGSQLESWTLVGLPAFGGSFVPESVSDALGIALLTGQQYWIELTPGTSDTYATWNFNSQQPTLDPLSFSHDGGTTWDNLRETSTAFDVLGNPIETPEPATLELLGSGFACLFLFRKRILFH